MLHLLFNLILIKYLMIKNNISLLYRVHNFTKKILHLNPTEKKTIKNNDVVKIVLMCLTLCYTPTVIMDNNIIVVHQSPGYGA